MHCVTASACAFLFTCWCWGGGGGSVLWLETSMTSEEHMTSHHQEDHWAVICVTNWKTKVIIVIKIMLLSSFERILKFWGFYETVEADSRRSCPPPSQWVVLAYLTNTVLETMKEMLSLSPAEWPCNRWGMTQNMTDKVTATSYTTTTKAHQVSVIICLHTVCVWTCG